MNRQTQTQALVLGATGGVGGEVTRVLLARGWTVAAMGRDPAKIARVFPQVRALKGDAMNANDVLAAAECCSLIVHAVNPPGYRDWDKLVLPMMDNTIAAARAVGARILLPGTVYNYGPDAFPLLTEDKPQAPATRKGAIRVEMERRIRDGGAPGLVVRAGDFFGGQSGGGSWFSQAVVKTGARLNHVTNPGRDGVGHAWAYLPDLAETMVQLVETTPAEGFQTYHFAGHFDFDGTQMARAIGQAVGRKVRIARFPWWLVALASPIVVMFREMREMAYLWKQPLRLDNRCLVAVLGAEPHTPLNQAVARTLADLGCS
jgi:nucleoside-diphosphate-sugar epimerase